jgi:ammonium transporter, Amt family
MGDHPMQILFVSVLLTAFLALTGRRRLRRKDPAFDGVTRWKAQLQSPEWRRYGMPLLAGKLTGIALLVLGTYFFNPNLLGFRVFAADAALKGNDIVNPINTVWTLVAAFLVFGMQVGFTMLEAGFCRSRETVNVLMECIVDTCLCGLLFYAFGFAFMFSHGNGFIGHHWFSCKAHRPLMRARAWRFWLFGFSSLRLPILARRLPRAR